MQQVIKPIEVFCSSVPQDKSLLDKLVSHLSVLIDSHRISFWHQSMVIAGEKRQEVISTHLETAQIILLLISADFLASDDCYNGETKRALERYRADKTKVHLIPIILSPCAWEQTPLLDFQVLPTGARPVTQWADENEALVDIVRGIQRLVEKISTQRPQVAFEIITEEKNPLIREKAKPVGVPIIAVMGTSGGVGKGTFVSCASQLIADNGYNIAIIDFDLEVCGTTRTAEKLFGSNNPHSQTVFDVYAKHSKGFKTHRGSARQDLWDITPPYLDMKQRGKIMLVAAAEPSCYESGWEVIANIPLPREQKLKELAREIVERIHREWPDVHCILIDCGAGTNTNFSAAFACADYGYIITRPQPQFFDTVAQIHNLHQRRYPQDNLFNTFTVVNRVTSDADRVRCQSLNPKGYIPDDPILQKDAFCGGSIDYDLGYNDVFVAIYQCLSDTFKKEHQPLLPDEREVRIMPWWTSFVERRLAEQTLHSKAFRRKTLFAWSFALLWAILLIGLLVSNVLPKFLFPTTVSEVRSQIDIILLLILSMLLVLGVRRLLRHEQQRHLLKRIAQMRPNQHSLLLTKLLAQADRASLRLLNELLSTNQRQIGASRISEVTSRE